MLRLFLALFVVSMSIEHACMASAADSSGKSKIGTSQPHDIEVQVWQATPETIESVEKRVVKMMQENPESPYAHFLLSRLSLEKFSQKPDDLFLLRQASELAQQTAELAPQSDLGAVATCEVLDTTGQTDKALTLLKKVMGAGVNVTWRSYFMLGRLSSEKESYDKVLQLYNQSLGFHASKKDIIIPHVIAILRSRHTDNADQLEKELMHWHAQYPHVLFLESLATVMIMKQNYRSAEKIYQIILKDDPQRIYTRINYAIMKINFLKKQKQGIKDLQRILHEQEDHITPEFFTLIHTNIAMALVEMKKDQQAREHILQLYNNLDKTTALTVAHAVYDKFERYNAFKDLLVYINKNISGTDLGYSLLGEMYAQKLNNPDLRSSQQIAKV